MPGATQRSKLITFIDGKFVEQKHAVISVFDNALLYAEGLFETFLAVDDRVIFLNDHLKRLYRGAALTGLLVPVPRAKLSGWIEKIAQQHPAAIKKIRLTMTSGESARWTGKQGKPKLILTAAPHEIPIRWHKLLVSDLPVDTRSVFRRIKTISYALNAAAYDRARRSKCDDALLLNEKNKVAEATSSNIFWVKNNRIYTPSLDDGCLAGVTRLRIIALIKKLRLPLIEKSDSLKAVLAADEVFVCSSLKLISPVSEIVAGKKRHKFKANPLASHLRSKFLKQVGVPS